MAAGSEKILVSSAPHPEGATPLTVFQKLDAMSPAERIDLYVWLLAQAESNAIEGEYQTADLTHFYAECVRQFPVVPKMEKRYGGR